YLPHSFVPLLRFEGDKPPTVPPLADKLEQEAGITLPPDFKHTLHHIEQALRTNRLSTEQRAWLNQVQLSPDYLKTLLDPLPDTPYAAQLYDCNHLGTPQQLINLNGQIDWSITLDAWGNTLSEENPHQLHQPIRMQGQQYDEESGLHYNRHRYYDPTIGRYITQDPIGLDGGMNVYTYPHNPLQIIDPLGLNPAAGALAGGAVGGPVGAVIGGLIGLAVIWALFSLAKSGSGSGTEDSNSKLDEFKDTEYKRAKSFCDKKPEKGNSDCASLSKAIDHAKLCASLYESWDNKWLPGRHDIKIQERKNRIKILSEQHRKECTNK
ncbi:RHS repeat-associated core domain-containing protein, partial [Hafnia alvei]|uniref:RHS repeat-associated core domain-containing protein n=1 Tax=Hafnia alvei TaxID=569 RepID=UPI00142ABD98